MLIEHQICANLSFRVLLRFHVVKHWEYLIDRGCWLCGQLKWPEVYGDSQSSAWDPHKLPSGSLKAVSSTQAAMRNQLSPLALVGAIVAVVACLIMFMIKLYWYSEWVLGWCYSKCDAYSLWGTTNADCGWPACSHPWNAATPVKLCLPSCACVGYSQMLWTLEHNWLCYLLFLIQSVSLCLDWTWLLTWYQSADTFWTYWCFDLAHVQFDCVNN